MKLDNAFLDKLHRLGAKPGHTYGAPVAKKLSLLLRPSFIARPGRTLVWGDWSNIEARVLPWLAASDGAEETLDIFRAVDKDPTLPDIYMRTGAALRHDDANELWAAYTAGEGHPGYDYAAEARQAFGKVPVLSLGFGGGLGALQAMATNYGVYLDTQTGKDVVKRWREENRWAVDFWGRHGRNESYGLWGAACSALENPDTIYEAGRVAYVYDRGYMGGTLFCALPDGIKTLKYPGIKWEWRKVKDKKTKEETEKFQLTFIKGYGRSALWYGKLAENITQAVAALVLKRTLKILDKAWCRNPDGSARRYRDFMPVVMHTHDEAVTEVFTMFREQAEVELKRLMETNEEWDAGLPLAAEIKSLWYYTKSKI